MKKEEFLTLADKVERDRRKESIKRRVETQIDANNEFIVDSFPSLTRVLPKEELLNLYHRSFESDFTTVSRRAIDTFDKLPEKFRDESLEELIKKAQYSHDYTTRKKATSKISLLPREIYIKNLEEKVQNSNNAAILEGLVMTLDDLPKIVTDNKKRDEMLQWAIENSYFTHKDEFVKYYLSDPESQNPIGKIDRLFEKYPKSKAVKEGVLKGLERFLTHHEIDNVDKYRVVESLIEEEKIQESEIRGVLLSSNVFSQFSEKELEMYYNNIIKGQNNPMLAGENIKYITRLNPKKGYKLIRKLNKGKNNNAINFNLVNSKFLQEFVENAPASKLAKNYRTISKVDWRGNLDVSSYFITSNHDNKELKLDLFKKYSNNNNPSPEMFAQVLSIATNNESDFISYVYPFFNNEKCVNIAKGLADVLNNNPENEKIIEAMKPLFYLGVRHPDKETKKEFFNSLIEYLKITRDKETFVDIINGEKKNIIENNQILSQYDLEEETPNDESIFSDMSMLQNTVSQWDYNIIKINKEELFKLLGEIKYIDSRDVFPYVLPIIQDDIKTYSLPIEITQRGHFNHDKFFEFLKENVVYNKLQREINDENVVEEIYNLHRNTIRELFFQERIGPQILSEKFELEPKFLKQWLPYNYFYYNYNEFVDKIFESANVELLADSLRQNRYKLNLADKSLEKLLYRIVNAEQDFQIEKEFPKLAREELNYRRLEKILEEGKVTSIDELVECGSYKANSPHIIIKKLGSGANATTYLAKNIIGGDYSAVKVLNEELNEDEVKILNSLEHKNIVEYKDVSNSTFEFKGKKIPTIRLEYLTGPTLEELFEQDYKFDPQRATQISLEMYSVIDYLLSKNIFHRDIHPGNIQFDKNNNIKLLDFGISVENINYEPKDNRRYGGETDMFSWALITYRMFQGEHLFKDFNMKNLNTKEIANDIYQNKIKTTKQEIKEKINRSKIEPILQEPIKLAIEANPDNIDSIRSSINEKIELRRREALEEKLGKTLSYEDFKRIEEFYMLK